MYGPKVVPWGVRYNLRKGAYVLNAEQEEVDLDSLFPAARTALRWNLKGWHFYGVEFEFLDFVGTHFADTTFDDCRFNHCTFGSSTFYISQLVRTVFVDSSLTNVDFKFCTFAEHNVIDSCILSVVTISNVADCYLNINGCNLSHVTLRTLRMYGTMFNNHVSNGCNISLAIIKGEQQFQEFDKFWLGPDLTVEGEHSWVPAMFDALPELSSGELWRLLKQAPTDEEERQRWLTELVLERGSNL